MIKNKNKIPMAASTALRNRPVIEPSKKNDDGNTLRFDSRSARKLIPLERNPADETEEAYLLRLGMKMDKSKIPAVLASSPDPFHSSALTKYMSLFEFSHDPIDISIRKLLMVVDLPSETQQIDRVIESFSRRYTECNRKLFPSSDKVYILAFSIIMLHTDSFNKSNKVKMSRADYVRNTKMNGIPTEVLEYVYDNVTYTPFVYVDLDRNICGQNITRQSQPANDNTGSSFLSLGGNNNNLASTLPSSNILPGTKDSRSKLDPYQLIAQGCTHELRLGLGAIIPSRNPFSFMGSANLFNFKHPRESFNPAKAVIIQVVNLAPSKTPSIFRQIEIDDSLDPGNYCQEHSPSACQSPLKRTAEDGSRNESKAVSSATTSPFTASSFLNLRAIKVGLVHLKVDTYTTFTSTQSTSSQNCTSEVSMIKNAISKKWKRFCLLLTARQLILIKDAGLAAELQESIKLAGFVNQANPEDRLVVRITGLKPELVLSLEGAIALSDSTYQRRPSTFRLILSKNLSLLVGVDDDDDMNSWIAHINYAATYKTQRLPYLPSNQFMSSPHPSMSMSPSTMANHHKKYLRTARSNDLNSRNEMISISLPSSPSFSTRITNHHPQDTAEVSYGKPIVSPTMASRSTPISISCSAGPSDLGPSFMGGRPRSNSFHFPPPLRSSSTTLHPSTHWDRVNAQMSLLEAQIVAAKSELNEDLRLARNLALLTPFQHSTRLRLQQSIRPLAHRVRSSRCQLSKLICYREVLACDFAHFTAAMKGVNSPTIDFEPNPGSTSQPRKGGRRCVDQPQESLFQNSKLPSQDEQHSRRRTSPKAVGRSSSTRKALDVLVGRQACNTGRGNTWADEPPLVRRSSLPAARIKRIRSSIGGSSPNHTSSHATAGALDSLKDSGIKRPVVEIISRGDSSLERKPRLSPPTPSTMLPACQPSLTKGTESARPMTKGDSSAQPVSCEDGDEVLEGMASLRKVGRHASEQWRPLAATLKLVQEQEEQDGATSGRLAGSGAMMRSLSLYRSGRRGSGTPTSARSLAAKSGTVSTDGDRRTSDSPRSSLKAPFLPASLAHRDSLTSSPSSSATHTSSLANPSLLQPPEASPLHSSSARRPSSCPTVSSSATTATQRAAARARMFSKAKLIAAQARSSFLFPASFLPPEQSSSVVVPIAASSGGAANLHPHCLPPADPQPSSSLLPTVPSSPTPDSDSDSSGSVIPVGNAARAPPPPSGYAKRFTYAWGLP